VLVLHDITELRRLENLRREFVANVSHELRTPVSVIRATAETLADGALDAGPEVAGGFVDAILRNSERLTRLISDLLDISRIDSGNYRTEITEVEVHETIARATQSVKDGHAEHRISVLCDTDLVVMADAFALEHVLINLLENAVKYTPSGSHVEVRVRASAGRVVVEVADDGPGIEAKHRPRVFERFYRVDAGRSREKGGTGLGLSIVKNLVQSMQGTVGVKPNEPRGSVFWFELPAATVRREEVA
jgi:two-component system phosphate regulon sensor histidine kinase PhoR